MILNGVSVSCFSIFCFVPKLFVTCGVNNKGQITSEKRMRKWCFSRSDGGLTLEKSSSQSNQKVTTKG